MKYLTLLQILVLALLLTGCETVPMRSVTMHRFQDVDGSWERRDLFGPGEVPCVVVSGYSGETVTAAVYNVGTGKLYAQETFYVPVGNSQRWWFRDIPNGSYKVNVSVGGSVVQSVTFSVAR